MAELLAALVLSSRFYVMQPARITFYPNRDFEATPGTLGP
jgi:hypothetical protein